MISPGLPNQWKEEVPTDGANDMEEEGWGKEERDRGGVTREGVGKGEKEGCIGQVKGKG